MILPDGTSQPEPSQNHFPGTGVRFLASLIDWAIIFLFAVIIGGGEASWWLVAVISQLYFTLGFGPVFAGRTVGKRLLTLKVVGTNGTPPSSAKAAVRSLPFALLPAVLSLAGLGVTSLMASPYSLAISLSLAASWVVTVYASVRLHPQRRGLHDLLAGTICVRPGVWASPLEKVSLRSQSVRALGAIWLMSAVSGLAIGVGLIWWFETASKALRLEDEALDSELPAVAVAYSEHLASLLLDPMKLSLLGEFPSTRYGDSSEFEMIFTAADTDSFKPAIKGIVQYLGTRRDQGFVGRDNFDVLVVRAVVPIGSIDDPRLRGVLLASIVANLHLPLPEGDLVIISLVQRTSEGKRCKVAYFAIHGKEHVAKDVFDAWYASFAPKCV